jgi:hypothetical protein
MFRLHAQASPQNGALKDSDRACHSRAIILFQSIAPLQSGASPPSGGLTSLEAAPTIIKSGMVPALGSEKR